MGLNYCVSPCPNVFGSDCDVGYHSSIYFFSHGKFFKVSLPSIEVTSIRVTSIGVLKPAMFWWFESSIPDLR
jgi:hypothetical protein